MLSTKETAFNVTVLELIIKGMQTCAKFLLSNF